MRIAIIRSGGIGGHFGRQAHPRWGRARTGCNFYLVPESGSRSLGRVRASAPARSSPGGAFVSPKRENGSAWRLGPSSLHSRCSRSSRNRAFSASNAGSRARRGVASSRARSGTADSWCAVMRASIFIRRRWG